MRLELRSAASLAFSSKICGTGEYHELFLEIACIGRPPFIAFGLGRGLRLQHSQSSQPDTVVPNNETGCVLFITTLTLQVKSYTRYLVSVYKGVLPSSISEHQTVLTRVLSSAPQYIPVRASLLNAQIKASTFPLLVS